MPITGPMDILVPAPLHTAEALFMNLIELDRALKQLRLGGMAAVLETRLRQAQSQPLAPIDLISCLVSDELARRGERLLERRKKQAPVPRRAEDPRQLLTSPSTRR
jgi:hypothetical protein